MTLTIDGTEPSEITIDGDPVQEITIDGSVAWSASSLTVATTLNGGSATLTLYEDTNGDGVPENAQTYTLQDGTNTYDISAFDLSSGNDLWYAIETDNSDVTSTIPIDYVELSY